MDNLLSKYQITCGTSLVFPHKCVCGNPGNGDKDKAFVDTGLDIDYYGAVYICKDCFVEMASGFGFFREEIKVALEKQLDDLNAMIEVADEENRKLKNALGDLKSVFNPGIDPSVSFVGAAPKPRNRSKVAKPSTEGESRPSEQTNESGPTELSLIHI